ncbi:hypothetical protein Gotur_005548 [Gossypium turneri]
MARSNTPINVDDGFNEYENVSKRQKPTTSKVWGEITKLECENKNELKAQCNHCKRGDSSIKTYKFDANECHRPVSTFLVCSKHSFRIVEELGFVSSNFKNSMLITPNPFLPLWPGVPMFWIMIMLVLVCIKSMLIGLIWEEIMMKVMIIEDT